MFARDILPPVTPCVGQGMANDFCEGPLLVGQAAGRITRVRLPWLARWFVNRLRLHGETPSFLDGLLHPPFGEKMDHVPGTVAWNNTLRAKTEIAQGQRPVVRRIAGAPKGLVEIAGLAEPAHFEDARTPRHRSGPSPRRSPACSAVCRSRRRAGSRRGRIGKNWRLWSMEKRSSCCHIDCAAIE